MRHFLAPALCALVLSGCSDDGEPNAGYGGGMTEESRQESALPETAAGPSVQGEADRAVDAATESFVRTAASSNLLEIRSSELALERSGSDAVTAFARRMISDHQQAAGELNRALQVTSLTAPEGLTSAHQAQLDALDDVADDRFDAEYLTLQTRAHEEAVELFSGYAENGENPEIRGFAATLLPKLQAHLNEVAALNVPGTD
jgi:putative membrane protein